MTAKNLFNSIYFEKVTQHHQKTIFSWLAEPHMQEFWDNSQEHKDDIITFINGRVTPSNFICKKFLLFYMLEKISFNLTIFSNFKNYALIP